MGSEHLQFQHRQMLRKQVTMIELNVCIRRYSSNTTSTTKGEEEEEKKRKRKREKKHK